MIWKIRGRLTYANVMSTLAVFLVIGSGTALASVVISSNSQVAQNTISGHKPPAGDHSNIIGGSVNGLDLATSSVGSAQLRPGAVNSLAIRGKAVTGAKLANGAVSNGKLANGAVSSAKIGLIPQARVEFTSPQTINNNSEVVLSFDTATYDNDGLFGFNHTRLIAPVAGVYVITANVEWEESNASGDARSVAICKNDTGGTCPAATGNLAETDAVPSASAGNYAVATEAKLAAGDFVDVGVYQNSGSTLHINSGHLTNFAMTWVGNG